MTATVSPPHAPANGSRRANPATVARRRQRNVPLGVLGVVIVLGSALGGLLWSQSATSTTEVLVAANDIPAGRTLADSDLRIVRLSAEDPVASIAANERTTVVGQVAAVPIPAGAVLARSEIGRDVALADDEAVVGAVLAPGASPTGDLRAGDRVAVIEADKSAASSNTSAAASSVLTAATVYAVERLGSSDGLAVSLRVPAAAAARVAMAAAGDRVRLVLLGPGATLPNGSGR